MALSSKTTEKRIIIALDGPAGSGKSTTARRVASELGYVYIDTGAMYRAITLAALREERSLTNADLMPILREYRLELLITSEGQRTILGREDVTQQIRSSEVTKFVSAVSALPAVREEMSKRQREMGRNGGVVMDGRDIGTVIFPEAELKMFLIASLEERTKRRLAELGANAPTFEELRKQIEDRDKQDTERLVSPLRRAPDAIELDTSNLSIDQQVAHIVNLATERIRKKNML